MKKFLPYGILGLAGVLALLSLMGEDSLPRLVSLQSSVNSQKDKNNNLSTYVVSLSDQVERLSDDKRFLEKAARNGKAMAKSNELIFLFEDNK